MSTILISINRFHYASFQIVKHVIIFEQFCFINICLHCVSTVQYSHLSLSQKRKKIWSLLINLHLGKTLIACNLDLIFIVINERWTCALDNVRSLGWLFSVLLWPTISCRHFSHTCFCILSISYNWFLLKFIPSWCPSHREFSTLQIKLSIMI